LLHAIVNTRCSHSFPTRRSSDLKVLDTGVVYPVPEFKRVDQAKAAVKGMVLRHHVELMAIGNGTAGRETEQLAAKVIRELAAEQDRKSTRLNSSHVSISYAVFCL